jgi:hypothetical protein
MCDSSDVMLGLFVDCANVEWLGVYELLSMLLVHVISYSIMSCDTSGPCPNHSHEAVSLGCVGIS